MAFNRLELVADLEAVLAKHGVDLLTCGCCGGATFIAPDPNDSIDIERTKDGKVAEYSDHDPDGTYFLMSHEDDGTWKRWA